MGGNYNGNYSEYYGGNKMVMLVDTAMLIIKMTIIVIITSMFHLLCIPLQFPSDLCEPLKVTTVNFHVKTKA